MGPLSLLAPVRAERRDRSRELARVDAATARRAELHLIGEVLADARTLVERDWVQRAWFAVRTDEGRRPVTAYQLGLVDRAPVAGACLVGAIVHGGGGPRAVRSQLVQRTLDLTWHALREDPDRAVRWCPSPPVRAARVRDLTRWNDHPDRRAADVVGLLDTARGLARAPLRG